MQGKSLKDTIASDAPVREAALFGIHGGHINCTDGRYVYMKAPVKPENEPLFNYTLMPSHMRCLFTIDELKTLELAEPFAFTKGLKTMKIRANAHNTLHQFGTLLFDTEADPGQTQPLQDEAVEQRMKAKMVQLMIDNDTPVEQYERVGLSDSYNAKKNS